MWSREILILLGIVAHENVAEMKNFKLSRERQRERNFDGYALFFLI